MWNVEKGLLPYRQAQTLEGIAAGKTNNEMATEAGVSKATIEKAVSTLFFKMKMDKGKRALLVANAIQQGVLTSTAAMLLVAICINTIAQADIEMRRSSTRLTTRVQVRNTRTGRNGRDGLWGASELGLEVDKEELAA